MYRTPNRAAMTPKSFVPTSILALVFGGPMLADAAEDRSIPGPIPATVIEVIDGDTLEVQARIWPDHSVLTAVRLEGVDAPELRGDCEAERILALEARDLLAAMAGSNVLLLRVRHDKFGGRVVAEVLDEHGRRLGDRLIVAGVARAYDGGARESWCD